MLQSYRMFHIINVMKFSRLQLSLSNMRVRHSLRVCSQAFYFHQGVCAFVADLKILWVSISSRVHIGATEYQQFITTCKCANLSE